MLEELISTIASAAKKDTNECVLAVKEALSSAAEKGLTLPERCCEKCPTEYSRHLVHMAPDKSFSVVAMVWGEGQNEK